jgi:hypothetical protein
MARRPGRRCPPPAVALIGPSPNPANRALHRRVDQRIAVPVELRIPVPVGRRRAGHGSAATVR